MHLSPDELPVEARNNVLTSSVILRPIAVVNTLSPITLVIEDEKFFPKSR